MQHISISQRIFHILVAFWLLLFIPIFVASYQVVVALPKKEFPQNLYETVLGWSLLPGLNLTLTVTLLSFLLLLTVVIGTVVLRESYNKSSRLLRKYLRGVRDKNMGLSPQGFAHQSQALISVNVPLDTIFIHLNAAPDRPIYDLPIEQQKQLEAIRQQMSLDLDEQENRIQHLRRVWHSQFGHEAREFGHKHHTNVEEILKPLNATLPVAVILGAPGSGKSTTMRWFALHMAQACLMPWHRRWLNALLHLVSAFFDTFDLSLPSSWSDILPAGLAPVQIPVLLRISDYAKQLSVGKKFSFKEFLEEQWEKDLSERLLQEMEKGHCLLLFDGLDEVTSDGLRRNVAEAISMFVTNYSVEDTARAHSYNRFIVTSRIVGYESGPFSKYAHYTLLDLEDEQIEQFLTNWCPAVERYQAMAAQGMKPLHTQQEEQARIAGMTQKERLKNALDNNPSIKRLAVNPLMLTILALIQKSGKTLPHRRIDLYEVVTRTLLDNWNQQSGRKMLPSGEISLAERLLSNLAYTMHTSDPLITERDVRRITCETMSEFYPHPATNEDAQQFIDTLRSSSGLFAETGQGLFSFMHRTFQEYYVALYLLDKKHYSPEALKRFAAEHYCLPIWREPLLLTIAYKSGQRDRDEQQQASDLIQAIADSQDEYDGILHHSLLFAASSIVDCTAWSIRPELQHCIANTLFDLYGDSYGAGRYTVLQKDIEEVVLLWLRGQPEGSSHTTWPPFLEAWRTALCTASNIQRQQGATHLAASLAPKLPDCPACVRDALVPPLLKLAHLDELPGLPCPPEIQEQMAHVMACPSTQTIEEYALVTLHLLDKTGPAGWLYDAWLQWNREQPTYLQALTQHSLELDYLLTPATFPRGDEDPNWHRQLVLATEWQKRDRRDLYSLQTQLLQASHAARFPCAYLFYRMLTRETQYTSGTMSWQEVWDGFLQEEMAHGRSMTYQTCLLLRLLLAKNDSQKRRDIADEIVTGLSSSGHLQTQALIIIINIYLGDLVDSTDSTDMRYWRYWRYLINLIDSKALGDLRNHGYIITHRNLMNLEVSRIPGFLGSMRSMINIIYMTKDSADLIDVSSLFEEKQLMGVLCNMLRERTNTQYTSLIILAIYSIANSDKGISDQIKQDIQYRLQSFEWEKGLQGIFAQEHHQLIDAIEKSIRIPDERVVSLHALKKQQHITASQMEEILHACTDKETLSEKKRQELEDTSKNTVQKVAWDLLEQQFTMTKEIIDVLHHALGAQDGLICAAAALLLRNNRKRLPDGVREEAARRIAELLRDDVLSRRSIDMPNDRITRLDDVLFETLRVLTE